MNYTAKLLLHLVPLLGLPVLAPAAPVAEPEIAGLELKPSGEFTFDGISISSAHFDRDWRYVGQRNVRVKAESGYPKLDGTTWTTRVTLQPMGASEPITIDERIEPIDANAFRLSLSASHPTGVPTREMYLDVGIEPGIAAGKSLLLDGVEVKIPAAFEDTAIFSDHDRVLHTLVLPSATGTVTIEGVFNISVRDRRRSNSQSSFEIRLRYSPGHTQLTQENFDATFRFTPHPSTAISLRDIANFGFRDDVEGDGRGGWTDQGSSNDMRILPAGPLQASGVIFDIVDADANDGRGALVLGRADQAFLPKDAEIVIPQELGQEATNWRNLYLLHSAAWLPRAGESVGRVILRHSDGMETTHEIISGRDVANWWSPHTLTNGAVGWIGSNQSSEVGLYVSRIPIEGEPVESIRLESSGTSMWMIAGISAAAADIMPVSPETPWTVAAGPEWAAYDHQVKIEPGSVFDFSAQLDAPAGKHGPLIVTPAGHFEFEGQPGVRQRFWGVNLVGTSACTPQKNVADQVAENLARSGYNTVRLHHFESAIQGREDNSSELKAEELDRLDYLFYALKERGLYLNIDLYASRTILPAEWEAMGMDPNTGKNLGRFKYSVPVSEEAFRIWSEFARNLLMHRNPYTGMTWGEDPALIGICLLNEDSPTVFIQNDPAVAPLWRKAFETWQQQPENSKQDDETDTQYFNRFVFETQLASEQRMAQFVRDLGVKTPLTGTNYRSDQALAFVRQHYDYVDNHQYWGHPSFPKERWKLPYQFRQTSATHFDAKEPRDRFPTRILGKPFGITEFSFVRPNRYRAEGGVLMPAYAGLQDWDVLYNFDYATQSNNMARPGTVGVFSLAVDPIGLLADRLSAVIFLRGDVEPGKGQIGFAVQADTALTSLGKRFPDEFSKIGLVTRIGSVPADPQALLKDKQLDAVVVEAFDSNSATNPLIFEAEDMLIEKLLAADILPAGSISADGKRYLSDTGQIELRPEEGVVKLITPRSELFVLPSEAAVEGDRVAVRNGWTYGTVTVLAVDELPIAESRRLLVTHLTDALPTGMRFGSAERRLQETNGKLPQLVERGSAELTLKLADGVEYRAWAVSPTGARQREVALTKTAEGWVLKAETVSGEGTQMAYEIEG